MVIRRKNDQINLCNISSNGETWLKVFQNNGDSPHKRYAGSKNQTPPELTTPLSVILGKSIFP